MRRSALVVLLAATAACGTPSAPAPHEEPAPGPGRDAPVEPAEPEVAWPALPDGTSEEVASCVRSYRELAAAPFPAQDEGQAFSAWYAGPFGRYVDRYNALRERCDAAFAALEPESAQAQVMLATQSFAHERMGQRAVPYEEEGVMFVMGRYWTLGAACTYQHCGRGPEPAWASLCRGRAEALPACPPVEPAAPEAGATPP